MSKLPLPPDVIGHMCALGGTQDPLQMCASCQRALTYSALLYLGAAGAELAEARNALNPFALAPIVAGAKATRATELVQAAVQTLLEIVKVDFGDTCNLIEYMSDDEYRIALDAFYRARSDHYTDPETGKVVFEPHEELPEDPDDAVAVD